MKRINSIDITRGLIMIIMALDHVRDLMHINSIAQSPTNLATTSPALFFTRWITYLCAPIFVFLAGTSAYLSFQRKKNTPQTRNFLLKRGAWLIVLEFTLVNFALFFDIHFGTFIFEVIAAIGFGFIILSLLINLSPKAIAITGLIIIFCHNLFALIPFAEGSIIKTILTPLFTLTALPVNAHSVFVMAYPPIPWLGIMLVGFASSKLFELPPLKRKSIFLTIGFSALVLFIIIRFINIYGESFKWAAQKNMLYTFLSFMNVTKYPPSLLFCLVTLGIMFLMLAFAEQFNNRVANIFIVYGKVPLFYFLVHFFVIHLTLIGLLLLQGFQWQQLDFASGTFGRPKGMQSGVGLYIIYSIWIAIVMILYKPCLWFGKYKAEHRQWWLKYL
jgi:uncharacterized membrane protein